MAGPQAQWLERRTQATYDRTRGRARGYLTVTCLTMFGSRIILPDVALPDVTPTHRRSRFKREPHSSKSA